MPLATSGMIWYLIKHNKYTNWFKQTHCRTHVQTYSFRQYDLDPICIYCKCRQHTRISECHSDLYHVRSTFHPVFKCVSKYVLMVYDSLVVTKPLSFSAIIDLAYFLNNGYSVTTCRNQNNASGFSNVAARA